MTAWDDGVNRDFVARLWKLAGEYESEKELIAHLKEFGGDVLELMNETDTVKFKEEEQ